MSDETPATPTEEAAADAQPKSEAQPERAAPPPPALSADQLSGKVFLRWNSVALVLGALVLAGGILLSPGQATPLTDLGAFDPLRFLGDARWDQGKAEVARYAAARVFYGQKQDYELVRIAVKEGFKPAEWVKGAGPDALKTIAIHDVPTHRPYSYRQQVVVHVPRADPRELWAAAMSSQEWCGATFVRLRAGPEGVERIAHSYWEGEGERSDRLPRGVVLADQVPFLVRAIDWQRTPALDLALLPTLLGNRAPASEPQAARLERLADEEIAVPAGTYSCRHVRVIRQTARGEEVDHYWIGTGPERPLVKFKDATGEGQLSSLTWMAYWEDGADKVR